MADIKLDSYLASYDRFNDWLIKRRYKYLEKFFIGNSCLELGIAEGTGVDNLLERFGDVTVVDGSKKAIDSIKEKYKNTQLNAEHSYFEEMDLGNKKFDTILMAHILEHVDDPSVVIKKACEYLSPRGVMIIDVPNGNSLHRQVGVKMGLLKKSTDLNEADLSIGHQRVYTPESFKEEIKSAGMKTVELGGMFIKVVSNSQTEKVFDDKQLEAFFKVGVDNPGIAAEIYAVAKKQ